jgi:hypothetical protein
VVQTNVDEDFGGFKLLRMKLLVSFLAGTWSESSDINPHEEEQIC